MADKKKVQPKNPSSSKATKKDDTDQAEERKTAAFKMKRKSSGLKKFH